MIPVGCVERCPGCRHRELSAPDSLQQKQRWVARNLAGAGAEILPVRGPVRRWGYRRKVSLHARLTDNGWEFGLILRRGREEEFIPIPECPAHASAVNSILAAARDLPAQLPLAFAQVSGGMLTLVLKEARNPESLRLLGGAAPALCEAGAESVYVNWHAAAGRRVLSARHMEHMAGPVHLRDGPFSYGPLAFRQQIPSLEEEAHGIASSFLGGLPFILDLYSGLGTTLARWLSLGRECLGIELVGEACRLAEKNAPGAVILKGKVEERLVQVKPPPQFGIYTNPPRDGLGERVCAWIEGARPEKIAYLSCNMRSLRDDLARLPSYRAQRVQPFDFFPQTDHVEALVLLGRK